MMFAFATARDQNLAKGSQLRVYNAIRSVIACGTAVLSPISQATTVEDDAQAVTKGDAGDVHQLLLATQLCECYPTALPELRNVATALAHQNVQ